MHIYYYDLYFLGEKLWDKSPKRPTKIAALKQLKKALEGRRHDFTCTLMRMCPLGLMNFPLASQNSLIVYSGGL